MANGLLGFEKTFNIYPSGLIPRPPVVHTRTQAHRALSYIVLNSHTVRWQLDLKLMDNEI